ncbi:hypothetical protein ABT269_28055 [Streptomyces viridosporus]
MRRTLPTGLDAVVEASPAEAADVHTHREPSERLSPEPRVPAPETRAT